MKRKDELISRTLKVLKKIKESNPENFSGIGLVCYGDEFDRECHSDLRPGEKNRIYNLDEDDIVDYLIDISDYTHSFHDGFHMIDEKGDLKYVAQYFVPPVVKTIKPNPYHGVRTYSSICGSTLKGVLFIAVICTNLQLYFFENGEDITERAISMEIGEVVNV